jgi:hypothetical protein
MRRPAKGATSHPPLPRPGYGFGRPLRPRPDRSSGWSWVDTAVPANPVAERPRGTGGPNHSPRAR